MRELRPTTSKRANPSPNNQTESHRRLPGCPDYFIAKTPSETLSMIRIRNNNPINVDQTISKQTAREIFLLRVVSTFVVSRQFKFTFSGLSTELLLYPRLSISLLSFSSPQIHLMSSLLMVTHRISIRSYCRKSQHQTVNISYINNLQSWQLLRISMIPTGYELSAPREPVRSLWTGLVGSGSAGRLVCSSVSVGISSAYSSWNYSELRGLRPIRSIYMAPEYWISSSLLYELMSLDHLSLFHSNNSSTDGSGSSGGAAEVVRPPFLELFW